MCARLVFAFTLTLVVVVGNPLSAADPAGNPPYVHAVIIKLKPEAPDGTVQGLIDDAHKMLAKVPSVRSIRAGKPAEKSTPGFAAKDYSVGLLVLFDNFDGLQAYDQHPLHKEYVEKYGKHCEKITVYDFQNEGKP